MHSIRHNKMGAFMDAPSIRHMGTLIKDTSKKARIIIVDDELVLLNMLESMLLKSGNDVLPFTNGEAALEAIASELPDIVLLDVSMPGMDGFQVCERIKQNPKIKNISVIFLSGHDTMESRLRGFCAGGVDYISDFHRIYRCRGIIGKTIIERIYE